MLTDKKLSQILCVRAEQIPVTGYFVEEEFSAEWISALLKEPRHEGFKATKPSLIKLSLMPETDLIHLTGAAHFALSCTCCRCAKEIAFEFPFQINLRLLPQVSAVDPDLDMELFADEAVGDQSLADDDLAVAYYADGLIDLSSLLREQLFLDLPVYPTCENVPGSGGASCQWEFIENQLVDEWKKARWGKLVEFKVKKGLDN